MPTRNHRNASRGRLNTEIHLECLSTPRTEPQSIHTT
jgi:hypothetical protein